MSEIVIILIVLGLIFIFVSFAITSKLESPSEDGEVEVKLPSELTPEYKERIDQLVSNYIAENVDGKLADIEAKLSEIVNEKTLALGDYAVTVNNEIERNHSEVVFLYSMLNDKQKEIYETATTVDEYRKDIEAYVRQNAVMNVEDKMDQELEQAIKDIDNNIAENADSEVKEAPVEAVDSSRDVILEMHKSGYSILEIAKHLGLGVGEVKLIVDLYQGGSN